MTRRMNQCLPDDALLQEPKASIGESRLLFDRRQQTTAEVRELGLDLTSDPLRAGLRGVDGPSTEHHQHRRHTAEHRQENRSIARGHNPDGTQQQDNHRCDHPANGECSPESQAVIAIRHSFHFQPQSILNHRTTSFRVGQASQPDTNARQ